MMHAVLYAHSCKPDRHTSKHNHCQAVSELQKDWLCDLITHQFVLAPGTSIHAHTSMDIKYTHY